MLSSTWAAAGRLAGAAGADTPATAVPYAALAVLLALSALRLAWFRLLPEPLRPRLRTGVLRALASGSLLDIIGFTCATSYLLLGGRCDVVLLSFIMASVASMVVLYLGLLVLYVWEPRASTNEAGESTITPEDLYWPPEL